MEMEKGKYYTTGEDYFLKNRKGIDESTFGNKNITKMIYDIYSGDEVAHKNMGKGIIKEIYVDGMVSNLGLEWLHGGGNVKLTKKELIKLSRSREVVINWKEEEDEE